MFKTLGVREPLSNTVAAKIEEAIKLRRFQTGDRLPSEHELCGQFGVSRTAVREALRTLSARGLVSIEKGRGNFVRDLSSDIVVDPLHRFLQFNSHHDSVLEVVHARQILEPSIAAMAALKHSIEDEEALRMDIEQLRVCREEYEYLAVLDMQFHLDIARATKNTLMPLLLDPIHKLLPNIKSSVYKTVQQARDSALEYHTRILDAIIRRDAEAARHEMTLHLKVAEKHALQMLAAQAKQSPAIAVEP